MLRWNSKPRDKVRFRSKGSRKWPKAPKQLNFGNSRDQDIIFSCIVQVALNPPGLLGKMFVSVLIALYVIEVLVLLPVLRSILLFKHETVW